MEDLLGDAAVLVDIRCFTQLLAQLVAVFKFAQHVSPVFLHAEHSIACTSEFFYVFTKQGVVKGLQRLPCAAAGGKQTRIRDQGSAKHYGMNLRVCL